MGSALTAVANRHFADEHGGHFILRIDDTDEARTEAGAETGILDDLTWLGIGWDEGPVHQSRRAARYAEVATRMLETGEAEREDDGAVRFREERRPTLLRADGRPTYQLASVVDDVDLGITHVIRGTDHLDNAPLHAALTRALGAEPPEYIHHGLLLGPDGTKLSKRHGAASLADLRERGIPAEAVRAYLEELGLPKHDVHYDEQRLRRLAVDSLAALSDEELAARADAPLAYAPALRGARDLAEARALAELISSATGSRADQIAGHAGPVRRAAGGRAGDARPRRSGRPPRRAARGRRRSAGAAAGAHRGAARAGAPGRHRRAVA